MDDVINSEDINLDLDLIDDTYNNKKLLTSKKIILHKS